MKNTLRRGVALVPVVIVVAALGLLAVVGSLVYVDKYKDDGYATNTNAYANTNSDIYANSNTSVTANTNASSNTNSAVNTNSSSNTNTATNPTAGWKTYTNSTYGYSVQYPPQYTIISQSTAENVYWTNAAGDSVIGIQYREESTDGALTTWFDHASNGTITLGGRTGKQYVFRPSDAGQTGNMRVAYVVQHSGKLLGVELIGDSALDITEKNILSTFKFTSVTAGWKTYTNTKWEYSVKYPNDWKVVGNATADASLFKPASASANSTVEWGIDESQAGQTVEQVIAVIGNQWSDRKESRRTVTFNGITATEVTVTTPSHPDWKAVDVVFERSNRVFHITNGAVENSNYAEFYTSFKFTN